MVFLEYEGVSVGNTTVGCGNVYAVHLVPFKLSTTVGWAFHFPLLKPFSFPPAFRHNFFLPFDLLFSSIYTSSSFPPSLSVFWLLLFNYSFHVPLPSFALSLDYLKFTAFRPKFSPLFYFYPLLIFISSCPPAPSELLFLFEFNQVNFN